jgi:tripartite-type tricarboxylate transporter receptor subunit TctC
MTRLRKAFILTLSLSSLMTASQTIAADDTDNFFAGKNMSMIIGSSSGGGYDTLARAVARHIVRHISGGPAITVRHMPGAGGIAAANHLYSVAAKDGSTIGLLRNMVPLEPLFGTAQADYDATKFNWIGTLAAETGVMIVWNTSDFRSIEDVRSREFLAASDGINSQSAFFSRVLNELLGTKIKVVGGYKGQNEAYLAIERGEVDSFGITYWSSLTSTKQAWLKDKKIRILLQYGPVREPELSDVPYAPDLLKTEEDRLLFQAAYSPLTLGRPFVLPPDVPAARVLMIRTAFTKMLEDPTFKEEAARLGLQTNWPRTGVQLQEELTRIHAMPRSVLDNLKRLANAR